jgi:hypothetical protein
MGNHSFSKFKKEINGEKKIACSKCGLLAEYDYNPSKDCEGSHSFLTSTQMCSKCAINVEKVCEVEWNYVNSLYSKCE